MDEFHNPCGGLRWRTLDDGQIEVEGRGTPNLSPTEAFAKEVNNSWRNFSVEIIAAATHRNVPASWLLALISVETGLWSSSREKQASQASWCCVGPAAIMLSNYRVGGLSSPSELWDPAKNIDTGAAIVAGLVAQGNDLPAVTAYYNAGKRCCPTSPKVAKSGDRQWNEYLLCSAAPGGIPYPELAIRANNFAISSGLIAGALPARGIGFASMLTLSAVGVGLYYLLR